MIYKKHFLKIILFFIPFTIFCTNLSDLFEKNNGDDFLHYQNSLIVYIAEESDPNPIIVAQIHLSEEKRNSLSKKEGLNSILPNLIKLAEDIEEAKKILNKQYDNIFISCDYLFNTRITLDFKNKTLYLPKYYSDIAHIINNFHTTDVSKLLSNKESFNFLYYNGFLNHDRDDLSVSGFSRINSGFINMVIDGEYNEYSKDESNVIKLNYENINITDFDLVTNEYKSYWGEGDWLVSKRYDDFSDCPSINISQGTSSSIDRANIWFNLRFWDNELEIYIDFSNNVILKDHTTITYRIDNSATVYNQTWFLSNAKTALFYPLNVKNFVKELMNGNKIIFLIKNGSDEYKFEIDLLGLEATLKPYFEL